MIDHIFLPPADCHIDLQDYQFNQKLWQKIYRQMPSSPLSSSSLHIQNDYINNIKLLALDVDGVLTDGQLYYSPDGEMLKVFNTLDGHGLKQLQKAGVAIAIISGRGGLALQARMKDLGVVHLFENVDNKSDCLMTLLQKLQLKTHQVAYMGDDEPDLSILNLPDLGLAVCPENAHYSVKQSVDICIQKQGGYGAVRSLCDLLLAFSRV
jgi:3-deoxy-D-manno-octulosonate 8-phosphate phosphatase (KDO 8-P phosphatase)